MYSGDLLRINGVRISGLSGYKINREKLWKDAERNMNGNVSASLIGVFPKLELVFRDALNEDQISKLCELLDMPYFTATYYDAKVKGTNSACYYASSYPVELMERKRGLFKTFTVNLVPVSKDKHSPTGMIGYYADGEQERY